MLVRMGVLAVLGLLVILIAVRMMSVTAGRLGLGRVAAGRIGMLLLLMIHRRHVGHCGLNEPLGLSGCAQSGHGCLHCGIHEAARAEKSGGRTEAVRIERERKAV